MFASKQPIRISTALLVFTLLTCNFAYHASAQASNESPWTPHDYPNPAIDTEKCGRQGLKSWVCDPDGIITYEQANLIEGILKDIADGRDPYAVAPCGELGNRGYQVAVALMRKMDTQYQKPSVAAQEFGKSLHDKWGVGLAACNNGILLLLSVDDRQVYISTGKGAMAALPDNQITVLIDRMKPELRSEDYATAIEKAVREIGLTLAGAHFKEPTDWGGILFFGAFFGIFGWVFVRSIWSSMQRRREYGKVSKLLDKLKREQREAMTKHKFPEQSCPICMEDLAQPQGPPGAPAGPSRSGSLSDSRVNVEGAAEGADEGFEGDESVRNPLLGRKDGHTHEGDEGAKKPPLGLPCGHVFCEPCIEKWLEDHNNCPICRKTLGDDGPPGPRVPQGSQGPQDPNRGQSPTNRGPQGPRGSWMRSRFPGTPPPRCWSQDAYLQEYEYRLNRLRYMFPYYMTDSVTRDMMAHARGGRVVDWESILRRDMQDRADRARLQQSGAGGTSYSFGGGSSGGGGGAGSSW